MTHFTLSLGWTAFTGNKWHKIFVKTIIILVSSSGVDNSKNNSYGKTLGNKRFKRTTCMNNFAQGPQFKNKKIYNPPLEYKSFNDSL